MSVDDEARAAGFELLGDQRPGGTSVVHRARRIGTDDVVALKVFDRVDERQLAREVSIGQRVAHQNLALPTESGSFGDGRRYAVSPWADGRPAADYTRRPSPLGPERVVSIGRDVSAGLAALHAEGIVHRDVSPANIVVGPTRAVLIDVGLGRSAADATITAGGDLAGTPRYLAPELIRGDRATPAADQYALAIVLHELFTGSWPFPGASTAATALHHQLYSAPTPLDEVDPLAPVPAARAIERALSKRPSDRWEDIDAFAAALVDERHDRPGSHRRRALLAAGGIVVATGAAAVFAVSVDPAASDSATEGAGATTLGGDGSRTTAAPTTAEPVEVDTTAAPSSTAGASTTVLDPDASPGTRLPTFEELEATLPAAMSSPAPAGAAGALDCNLLTETSFEDGFVTFNFFNNPDTSLDGSERVIERGVDGSAALAVGEPGRYGRYAETVPVAPGTRYRFSAVLDRAGDVTDAALVIGWLDADFVVLDEVGGELPVTGIDAGRHSFVSDPAPDDAAYAVPQVAKKDGSSGFVVADELVFAEASSDCDVAGG